MLLSALVNLSAGAQYSTIQVNSHSHSLRSLSCIMQYYFFRGCWHFQIPSPSTVHKWGGKLLSSPDRVFFVIATIIYFSSPPLFLAPRFWEPRDQPQPGFFLEGRERTLGTWLIMGDKVPYSLYDPDTWEETFFSIFSIWLLQNRDYHWWSLQEI